MISSGNYDYDALLYETPDLIFDRMFYRADVRPSPDVSGVLSKRQQVIQIVDLKNEVNNQSLTCTSFRGKLLQPPPPSTPFTAPLTKVRH